MLDYKPVTFYKGMIIIQDAVISFIEKIKDAKRLHKLIAFFVITVILLTVSVIASGVRVTYNVKYNDAVLANVTSRSVYDSAIEKASASMSGTGSEIAEAKLEAVLTVNSKGASDEEVSQLILKNSPSVCYGFEVKAGDKTIAFVTDKNVVSTATDARLASFNVKGAECKSSFTEELTVKPAYFHIEKLTSDADVKTAIDTLNVKTVAVTKKVYTVKYDTITKKDSSKNAGYQSVLTKGVNGSKQTTEQVTYLNGVAVSEPVVSDVVLEYPIDQVLLIGTKNVYISYAPQNASTSGFKWPLSVRGVLSSDYGPRTRDYHYGIDLAVPEGTSIIAVKGGRVIEASYDNSYGYYVLIDHGNGVKTRYAHNKRNVVSVGQTVSAGQLIALSGNTGNSSGPHLHFEVIINGNRVNPGYYIDLSSCPRLK